MSQSGKPAVPFLDGEKEPATLQEASERGLASNQLVLTLSYSLMKHVRHVAYQEGVSAEDILVELVSEGLAKRVFQEQLRPAPSHFMTRTGYVPPEANGNVRVQPILSHHAQMGSQGFQSSQNFQNSQSSRNSQNFYGQEAGGHSPRRPTAPRPARAHVGSESLLRRNGGENEEE